MVPLAVVVAGGAGAIGKVKPAGLGVGDGLGETDGLAATDGEEDEGACPQPDAHASTITANHALADVNSAWHRVLALPLQVTGAGRVLNPARAGFAYACLGSGVVRRRRQTR